MKIPLHHNSRKSDNHSGRAIELVELWSTMASLNPNGFRQFRTGRHAKQRRNLAKTPLERISDLDARIS